MAKSTEVEVHIEGRTLKLTNLEKVLYPEVGFTKAQVIDYYTRIAPAILPHTRDHPLTLKRYPNGVDAEFFYEKNCPKHRPPWVETATVWSGGNKREDELLASCYRTALSLASQHRLTSIAFPAISTGVYSFPPARAAHIAVDTMAAEISVARGTIAQVVFCCFSPQSAEHHIKAFDELGLR